MTNDPTDLHEGRDYYLENGMLVFTAEYHLRRGSCCGSGCRHCPYRDPQPPREETPRQP